MVTIQGNLKRNFRIASVALLSKVVFVTAVFGGPFDSPAEKIAAIVKSKIAEVTDDQMLNLMKKQFVQMRLMDESGNWAAPELKAHSNELLPVRVYRSEILNFIDDVASTANKNDYLRGFLESAKNTKFKTLQMNVDLQGHIVFPVAVAYAMDLERLTKVLRNDWTALRACSRVWEAARKKEHLIIEMIKQIPKEGVAVTTFDIAKLFSVQMPIDSILTYQEEGKVPADFLKVMLPVNIGEAIGIDMKDKFFANAAAGAVLAANPPGGKSNSLTGEGPAQWSSDGNAIRVNMPLAEQWANLYSTWNLAFVSNIASGPFVMSKLLIPQVANHYGNSSEYIYNRAIALLAHLHYALLGRLDHGTQLSTNIDWRDSELTEAWGAYNLKAATSYQVDVNNAKGIH